ncbi:MAG: hypothetical protein ACREJD_16370 [Phycisphaerales bacterium]
MNSWLRVVAAAVAFFLCVAFAEAGAARKPKVLLVHSLVAASDINDVVGKLSGSGVFQQVDAFNANAATPTLVQLKAYDAVMLTNQNVWADRVALGNVMAQYVDAGYGVVQTIFTSGGIANSDMGGAWNATYNCITFGPSLFNTAATLGTIALPNHATMIGVGSFNGGTGSYRPSGTALTAGATLIASWSDGKPLVVAGPKLNRVDLGFYPPSSSSTAGLWDAATDGTKLMVNALLYTMRPKVLVVHSFFSGAEASDVAAKLSSTGALGGVDLFDASLATPTLATLQNYDALLVANGNAWANRDGLGNVVADFVDAGGGVVQSVFTSAGVPASDLGGRFTGDYRIIPFGISLDGAATLGAVTYASHPIMAGVAVFNGGSRSSRPVTTTFAAGGLLIAQWSDGKTLVATSKIRANRADLGFYPPSGTVSASYWNGDGAKLMTNALVYVCKPYVACVAADSFTADVPAKLIASRRFSGVGVFDANAAVPALSALSPFNGVLTWSNSTYANTTTLGNTLADYVDAGGAGVTALFGNAISGAGTPQGRWVTQGYDIVPTASLTGYLTSPQAFLGAILEPSNPVALFVRKFDGGANSFRMNSVQLLRGRAIMNWSDGKTLASVHNFRKRVDLGYWPVSNSSTNGWNHLTDGTWMTANALEYAVRHAPCPGDLNGDGEVDDADFVLFATYYNNLVDPRGDLNGDGLTEDTDFVIFAGGYDVLVCP